MVLITELQCFLSGYIVIFKIIIHNFSFFSFMAYGLHNICTLYFTKKNLTVSFFLELYFITL